MKMNTKTFLVSICTIALALVLVSTVSAFVPEGDLADTVTTKINGMIIGDDPAIIAGETITLEVKFTANFDVNEVKFKAEIEGDKVDFEAVSEPFDVEAGHRYTKTLILKVPYELKDDLSDEVTLDVKIWGKDSLGVTHKAEKSDIVLRVQRPSYNVDIKSINVANTIESGETFPVEIVLKNVGYNDLDDLYISAKISALGLEKTSYFGDLVAIEEDSDDDDETDTISGKIYLNIPYDVKSGVYALEVEVSNDDMVLSEVKQIVIENQFSSGNVIVSGSELIIVNPTDKVKVYKIIPESPASVSESIVVIQAGSSKTISVNTDVDATVSVLTMDGELVGTYAFKGIDEDSSTNNPIVILTVVLAIVFLVLLIILIVLIGKKPEKSEEFGESYY